MKRSMTDTWGLGSGRGEEMTRKGGASPDVCPPAPDTLATPLPIWSRYLITDGRTKGQTTCLGNSALRVASRGKNSKRSFRNVPPIIWEVINFIPSFTSLAGSFIFQISRLHSHLVWFMSRHLSHLHFIHYRSQNSKLTCFTSHFRLGFVSVGYPPDWFHRILDLL